MFTFSIILSNGLNARSFESLENINAPNVRTPLTNIVLINDNNEVYIATYLVLKTPSTSADDLLFNKYCTKHLIFHYNLKEH